MSVSTANIGLRRDGTFEQYAPPRVVALEPPPPAQPEVDATPVAVANGAMVPPGVWITVSGMINVVPDPGVAGQLGAGGTGTSFVSNGANAQAATASTLYRVRG